MRAAISPFPLFRTTKLSRELKNKWRASYKPVFKRMIGDDPISMLSTNVETYHELVF